MNDYTQKCPHCGALYKVYAFSAADAEAATKRDAEQATRERQHWRRVYKAAALTGMLSNGKEDEDAAARLADYLADECLRLDDERVAEVVRRPVVCGTCEGEGRLYSDDERGMPTMESPCPDCGKDGAGPGVAWEGT